MGCCVLLSVTTTIRHDLVELLWMDESAGGYRSLQGPWLVQALGGPTQAVIWALVGTTCTAATALVFGVGGPWGGRLIAWITLQGFIALSDVNSHAGGSDDELLANALWLVVLSESTATLSVHCRLRFGTWMSERCVPAWPRYLAIIQILLMYSSTGMQKVSIHWIPGGDFSALYYILQQPSWQRIEMLWLAPWFPVTQIATAIAWAFEVFATPLLLVSLWWRTTSAKAGRLRCWANRVDLRCWVLGVGVILHLGIFATLEVGAFSWIVLGFYLSFFHPDEWKCTVPRWIQRGSRSAQTIPLSPPPT